MHLHAAADSEGKGFEELRQVSGGPECVSEEEEVAG